MDGVGELVWRRGGFSALEIKDFYILEGGSGNTPRPNFVHRPNETNQEYWNNRWGALVTFRLPDGQKTKTQVKWVIEQWVDNDHGKNPSHPATLSFSAWQKTGQTREVPVED